MPVPSVLFDDHDRARACRVATTARYARAVDDTVTVRCPYCREHVELYVDPDTQGQLVEDCAVCCSPWLVTIERTGGRLRVQVARAQ